MRISGFSFARNAVKLYYPVAESIRSILPIVDEFWIAIGKGDTDDATRDNVASIGDPKVHIIDTQWEDEAVLKEKIYSQQTNIALSRCIGDWCFYLQADEVVHEADLPVIRSRCEELLSDKRVEGLLFDYLHFWGDYRHHHTGHGWYKSEIRVIRNGMGIKSWTAAQSFRGANDEKLAVAKANSRIFHYGWVRPPELMQKKNRVMAVTHHGEGIIEKKYKEDEFDYGPLSLLSVYEGTHPAVMKEFIEALSWQERLRDVDQPGMNRKINKHEWLKYRILSVIERWTGLDFSHKNYRRLIKA